MAPKKSGPFVGELAADVLSAGGEPVRERSAVIRSIAEQLRCWARRDYAGPLRVHLGRCDVQEVVREARRKVWPRLNREPATLVSPREFTQRWSDLGVDFRLANLSWPGGLALLGFYVKKTRGLFERPMICVNTAHHPAIVGAAFVHEMGHHLISQIFGSQREPLHLLLSTSYAEHLDDSAELAADVVVSLAAVPRSAARTTFKGGQEEAGWGLTDAAFSEVLCRVAVHYGLKFDAGLPGGRMLQALAAVIHYGKLRQALIDEYDI